MYEWRRQIQQIVDEIDGCIRSHDDAALTLRSLSRTLGYSEYYTTRKFREISGMQLRDYLRRRRLGGVGAPLLLPRLPLRPGGRSPGGL